MMKEKITFVFQNSEGIPAETAVMFGGPLQKGEAFAVENFRAELSGAPGDVFSYELHAKGCRICRGAVILTAQDLKAGEKVIFYSLQPYAGTGYEPWILCRWTPEVERLCFSEPLLENTESILGTPYFLENRGEHCFTGACEAEAFLENLCADHNTAYFFPEEKGKNSSAVIFTEEKIEGMSLDAALDRLASDKKVKVLYQAQIHGNEPASGEGALAVAEALVQGLGDRLLKMLDIVMIPRVNEVGSAAYTRGENGLNLNRDGLLLRSETMRNLHRIFCSLMPEILIDAHEFDGRKRQAVQTKKGWMLDSLDDIQITCVDHLNRGRGIFEIEERMMLHAIDALREQGFRGFFFPGSFAANTSCGYARLMHCFAFLIESNGIRRGGLQFARRVTAQREAVLDLLEQSANAAEEIGVTVSRARSAHRTEFVLEQKIRKCCGPMRPRPSFDFLGRPAGTPDRMVLIEDRGEAVRTMPVPAAYLLLKDFDGAFEAAEILKCSGAVCSDCAEGWLFLTDQPAGNIICAALAADLGNVEPEDGSLIQAGVLAAEAVRCIPEQAAALELLYR